MVSGMDSQEMLVSIVIEWENALLSEAARSQAMLSALRRQAEELAREPAGLKFELLLVFDKSVFEPTSLATLLKECLGEPDSVIEWRLIPAPDQGYYQSKNHGASQASGGTVVFLDSDVIPEPGWLKHILATLEMPAAQIATGNAYIEPDSLVAKSFALSWFFPLRCEDGPIREEKHFFANNLAMHSAFCRAHPFPDIPGSTRGSCVALADSLAKENIPIHYNPSARVSHPPPNGFRHISKRALAQGRDRVVLARHLGHRKMASWPASFLRLGYHLVRATWNCCTKFHRVGLNPLLIPAALIISTYYYTLYWAGETMYHLRIPAISKIRV
jgi:glycosyltransferase involved in cell wall biosynthesis